MNRRLAMIICAACPAKVRAKGYASEGPVAAADSVALGTEYEVVGNVYVHGVAADLNRRVLSYMVLVPLHLSGPEILFSRPVSSGSRLRVVARSTRRWPAFLYPDEYVVEVDSLAPTSGVPVLLGLSRGNEGSSGSLNPLIYRRLK